VKYQGSGFVVLLPDFSLHSGIPTNARIHKEEGVDKHIKKPPSTFAERLATTTLYSKGIYSISICLVTGFAEGIETWRMFFSKL